MSTDYYHWGPWLRKGDGSWMAAGYLTGSGLPMQFVDQSGDLVPVYQQATQLVDEHMIAGVGSGYAGLTPEQAITASRQLIDESVGGYYSALTVQAHTDYKQTQWLSGIASYAASKGMPIWTAQRWLAFTQARHDAQIRQYEWDPVGHRLSFQIFSSSSEPSITAMVPSEHLALTVVSVTLDGVPVSTGEMSVKGFDYTSIAVPSGDHTVVVIYGDPNPKLTRDSAPTAAPVEGEVTPL